MVSNAVKIRKPLVTHSTRLKGMFLNMGLFISFFKSKTNLFLHLPSKWKRTVLMRIGFDFVDFFE